MKLIDLTGQTFGRLTVIERAPGPGPVRWVCECVCGLQRTAPGTRLRDGRAHSCRTACLAAVGRRPWPHNPRVMIGPDGSIVGTMGRLLKASPNTHGYLTVSVPVNGVICTRTVHRMVCETFHGPCPDGMEVAHGNGAQTDNRAANLRWATKAENAADRALHGNAWRGEKHHRAKITENDVRAIREASTAGAPRRALARQYGLSKRSIQFIVQRRNWAHVS
jgi:hypothetical protein